MTGHDTDRISTARQVIIDDPGVQGLALGSALAQVTDVVVQQLAEPVFREARGRFALVAVGGYGARRLAPFSDLDLVLVHDGAKSIEAVAEQLWYPLWDAGLKLGHAVVTLKQARGLVEDDLDSATSYLSARLIAGDAELGSSFADLVARTWTRRADRWLAELVQRTEARHQANGEVAFMLEPDLKEGRGGLRDIQVLGFADRAGLRIADADRPLLQEADATLFGVRVELHRSTSRRGDVLRLDDQDAVATRMGLGADELMAIVAAQARTVAWIGDEAVRRAPGRLRREPDRPLAPGIVLAGGEVTLGPRVDPALDPSLVLRVARAAARADAPIARATLERLAACIDAFPDPWPAGARDELVALLLEGRTAIPALEAIDQAGLLVKVLPEWEAVRSRPQRNAYHRFTVDRHLWEATANAARLAERVGRPDLLVVGTLLHDLGKGRPGDHTEVGVILAEEIGPRLGFPPEDVAVIVALVRYHLLLPDVATRRDLADPGTIRFVADAVGTPLVLELLHALTEADSLATGPSAWGTWKAELVAELVERVGHVLGGGAVHDVTWRIFPTDDVLELMAGGVRAVRPEHDRLLTVAPDRPGLFSRVAGVISLHGLDVLSAEAHSDEVSATDDAGRPVAMAANEFRIAVPKHGIRWDRVVTDLERALAGQLAIEARLADRARTYRRKRALAADVAAPSVEIDNHVSSNATVIEVRAPDRIGILYRITKALGELDLDIRHAKVQTLGDEVIDTFYVRSGASKVLDPFHIAEIERALLHAVQ